MEFEEGIMSKYIAAIDQGTTSTRCMLFDHSGKVVSLAQKEHHQIYPQPGWVEHDPLRNLAANPGGHPGGVAKAGVQPGDIAAIGITNQRETTLLWDRRTGKPYYNAIVWQDTRTKEICDELALEGGQDRFRAVWACPWQPTSPVRKSSGSWIMYQEREPQPSAAMPSLEISIPG